MRIESMDYIRYRIRNKDFVICVDGKKVVVDGVEDVHNFSFLIDSGYYFSSGLFILAKQAAKKRRKEKRKGTSDAIGYASVRLEKKWVNRKSVNEFVSRDSEVIQVLLHNRYVALKQRSLYDFRKAERKLASYGLGGGDVRRKEAGCVAKESNEEIKKWFDTLLEEEDRV